MTVPDTVMDAIRTAGDKVHGYYIEQSLNADQPHTVVACNIAALAVRDFARALIDELRAARDK